MLLTAILSTHLVVQTFTATAYSLNGPTRHGEPAGIGIVAVDPKVIPLGTKLNIEGLGEFVALDTGRLIKGHRIDIWMPTKEECLEFGKKKVEITILPNTKPPPSRGAKLNERGTSSGRDLGGQNENLRTRSISDSNSTGARQNGYHEIREFDRHIICKGQIRPLKSQNYVRAHDPFVEGYQDRILPHRKRRYPKGERSFIYPVCEKAKGRRVRINHRERLKHSRGKIFLHGGSYGHFERQAQFSSDSSGVCEAGEGFDEIGEGKQELLNRVNERFGVIRS